MEIEFSRKENGKLNENFVPLYTVYVYLPNTLTVTYNPTDYLHERQSLSLQALRIKITLAKTKALHI